jgi:class 3 adenylate cyclase/tetratricopeptide (TPR) repeat protein
MKCPKCHTDNPETRKFCRECGCKLLLICPQCSFENLPGDKFCGECGSDLQKPQETTKELSFHEKIDKIQRFLPKGITEKILSQRGTIEGEKKQVTVMFCDLEGFTSLVENLGSEKAYNMMDQIYEILIHKVHEYEGTVNEMTGDGVMALFGAPIALEDAPQRAIRSAMSIHRELAIFNDKQANKSLKYLKMRIGIHSGPVVVGSLGNDLRVEFKAVGNTVNIASRVEGLAEPGATYVTGDTFNLTTGIFRFESLGKKKVKGLKDLIQLYRVIAASSKRTRFDVNAEKGLSPFIGRQRELDLLMDSFERSKNGRGQAVSILAEAGVGKSRLLYEFRKAVANENVTFMEGKCLSYSRGVAYHPIIDILKSIFDIEDSDKDFEVIEKLKHGLKMLEADEPLTLPYLLELLSIKDSGVDPGSLSPEARKDRIIEALNRISIKFSQIQPVIMAIEDLHWIDKNSEDVLKSLFESISGERVFLIFTYRSEYNSTWGAKSYLSQVNLNRLSHPENLAMATHLLGTEEIDRQLEELILGKTEGIPFFVEELIKSLKDLKIIEKKKDAYHLTRNLKKATIPSTIQDVIMARVDKLPVTAKELLQTGSVIEREFTYDLISRVSDLPEKELLSNLSILKASEILFERGIYPKTIHIFNHALSREVIYASMTSTKRMNLHQKIADAIEDLYKTKLYEHYEVLSEHYNAAEDYHKAANYSGLAAKKAIKKVSINDAIIFGYKAIGCLEKLPSSEETEKNIITTRTNLGLYYSQLNRFVKAKEIIDPAVDLAIKHDMMKSVARMYNILGSYHTFSKGDLIKGSEYFKQAIKISEEIHDYFAFSQANFWYGAALTLDCNFDQASQCYEKALSISVAGNSLWGISVTKSNWSYYVFYQKGDSDKAHEISKEAVASAEESGDVFSKAWAYMAYGASCFAKGYLDEALEFNTKSVDYCDRIDALNANSTAQLNLALIHFARGEYKDSEYRFRQSIAFMEKFGAVSEWINCYRIGLAMARVMNNKKDIDLKLVKDYVLGVKIVIRKAWAFRFMGHIMMNIDKDCLTQAEYWIKKAIEVDRNNRLMFHLGEDYALYAEFFKRKGDQTKVEKNLNKAIEIFKECGADGWMELYENKLAEL